MARKVSKPASDDVDSSPDEVEPDQAVLAPPKKSITKAGAARAALADGIVIPKEASRYILEKFGLNISPQQFSAEKSRLKHRTSEQGGFARFGAQKLPDFSRSPIAEADLIQVLEVMKPLIDQLGKEKVKRMVDLLG